ncbi:AAA family ATPase [Deinococcus sp. Leaf326]|uniref:AAA family ATPase n=1 Tax=Deinococcus sp. Leaf326 TaxID=1736338 RepID=UPI000701E0C6|nr:AAA family ATPase [Deinococcus sp. Leaf326]KQR35167.1 hypothetical protein ASF71_16430 [Deinococcus sp. Leaf326]
MTSTNTTGAEQPQLFMFAGPNGSGKSTITTPMLADLPGEYINADDIARAWRDEIPDPLERNRQAARLADRQRQLALREGRSLVFETVMSTPEKVALLTQAKALGYQTTLIFVTTSDAAFNVRRVQQRVILGGHDVEPDTIRRRYEGAMTLLAAAVEHADQAVVIDNSGTEPQRVAQKFDEQLELLAPIPAWVTQRLDQPWAARQASRRTLQELAGTPRLPTADAREGQQYSGVLVGRTAWHLLQRTAQGLVLHDLSLCLVPPVEEGEPLTLRYHYERGKLSRTP